MAADPGRRHDIDTCQLGHTVTDAPKLLLNLFGALRACEGTRTSSRAMGLDFSAACLEMKRREWDGYAAHFTRGERDAPLDVLARRR